MTSSIIFVVVTVVLASLYFAMPLYYQQVKSSEARREFDQVARQIKGKSRQEIGELLTDYSKKSNQIWFTLLAKDNTILYPSVESGAEDSLQLTIVPTIANSDYESKTLTETIAAADGQELTLNGEYSLQPVSDASRILLNLYPFVLLLSLSLGGIAAYLYSRASSQRIKAISRSTRQMISLAPDVVCPVKGRDEIAELADDINRLYANLLTSMEALRQENEKVAESEREKAEFLRMTSHELKTPITSMMGMVDGMIYGVGEFKDRDRYLQKCREILEEQSDLVQSILAISKLEMQTEKEQEVFSLKQLLEENLGSYRILADVRHYHFQVELAEARVKGNRTYLLKAIKNLLDNAFHYTVAGGQIVLRLESGQLIIENEAERVLDQTQIQQIFQPFYRPDYSRNRKDGGTGLGLFIVQQILDKHGLSYLFEAVDLKAMRFTIFLPSMES
nr:HAMP domain-containing sensor histidine kinase [Streptococcus panodentis]